MITFAGTTLHKDGEKFVRGKNFSYWALGYIHSGVIRVQTGKGSFYWPAKGFNLVVPGLPYQEQFATEKEPRCKESWVIFAPRESWYSLLKWPELVPGMMALAVADYEIQQEMLALLKSIEFYVSGIFPEKDFFAENAREKLLLLANLVNPMTNYAKISKQILDTMNFMAQNYANKLTVSKLAKKANLSPSRFAHLFNQQVGMTPRRYLERHRLEKARQLLITTHLSVGEVAEKVGFDGPFYFSTRFRRDTRRSPAAFRKFYSKN
jgi:AraC family transcriptional regulator of arabinose operon